VYGSIAKRTDTAGSDIDVLLLWDDLAHADVFGALEAASSTLGRPVNPTILTSSGNASRTRSLS
jgi:predicted nucleotidyltransferase